VCSTHPPCTPSLIFPLFPPPCCFFVFQQPHTLSFLLYTSPSLPPNPLRVTDRLYRFFPLYKSYGDVYRNPVVVLSCSMSAVQRPPIFNTNSFFFPFVFPFAAILLSASGGCMFSYGIWSPFKIPPSATISDTYNLLLSLGQTLLGRVRMLPPTLNFSFLTSCFFP